MYSTFRIEGATFKYQPIKQLTTYPKRKGVNKAICICKNMEEGNKLAAQHKSNIKIVVYWTKPIVPNIDQLNLLECYFIVCVTIDELNNYINAKDLDSEKTYCIFGTNYRRKYFDHLELRSWSFIRLGDHVDYQIYEQPVVKSPIRYIKSTLKSMSNHQPLLEYLTKDKLYTTFGSKHVPLIIQKDELDDGMGMFIFKPAEGSQGDGIFIIDTNKPWREELEKKWVKKDEPYAICQYINNPLLFDGKKFHLRSLMVCTSWGSYSSLNVSRILTAKLPFVKESTNPDVFDSHAKSTIGYPIYPDDMQVSKKELRQIRSQILDIHEDVFHVAKIECYPESQRCYNVFGLDLLIDEDLKVWILEINKKPLMQSKYDMGGPSDKFDKQIAQWLMSVTQL